MCNARLAERVGGVCLGVSATGNRNRSTRAKAKGSGGERVAREWDAGLLRARYLGTAAQCCTANR